MIEQQTTANQFPPSISATQYGAEFLTKEQEVEISDAIQKYGDESAINRLVTSHYTLVRKVVYSMRGYGLDPEDLFQEGCIGLMKAARKFDASKGARFFSYAAVWIRAEIQEYAMQNTRIMKIATTHSLRKLYFNLKKYEKAGNWLSAEETQEIADSLEVSPADVTEMELRLRGGEVGFDSPLFDDDEGGVSPEDFLTQDNDPEHILCEDMSLAYAKDSIDRAIGSLKEREQDIIRSRWMSKEKTNLRNLAVRYDISAERVRQIELNAMQKLKIALAN